MTPDQLDRALADFLQHRRSNKLLRQRTAVQFLDSTHLLIGNRRYVNFASNNYLGLTHHPRVLDAVRQSLEHGAGSGAAGLISGYSDLHQAAEQTLARWKGSQSCVLLPSGYQANLAAVQTLAACGSLSAEGSPGIQSTGQPARVRFLLDKLVHASLIDAVRASGAEMRIFPHNRLDKLRRLLRDAPANQLQVVVTESIFSMDGDFADLQALAEIKRELPFVLLLDEAHGSGVYGPAGAGYAAELGLQESVDVSVVTLSKALGCAGGAVCASQRFCDAMLNLGRAYIYSTSIAPMVAAAARAAVQVCQTEPDRQARVRSIAIRVRGELSQAGWSILPGDSPIVPLICGDEQSALKAADTLCEEGLYVVAVRPPTVPRNASRLRITLSSDHTDEEIDRLVSAVRKLKPGA